MIYSARDFQTEYNNAPTEPNPAENIDYFIWRYLRFDSKPLVLREKQRILLAAYENHRHNFVLKSRADGVTLLTAAYMVHNLIFRPHSRCYVLAPQYQCGRSFLRLVADMLRPILPEFDLDFAKQNSRGFTLTNGAKLSDSVSIEGLDRTSTIYVEEPSIFALRDETLRKVEASMGPNNKVILAGTPEGHNLGYHDLADRVERGNTRFHLTDLRG